jgi:tellurite resistance protein TerC
LGLVVSTLRQARRLIVAVIGFTVLLIGVALLVLPGPAVLVIPAGLAILATEFVWARRLLEQVKRRATRIVSSVSEAPRADGSDRSAQDPGAR